MRRMRARVGRSGLISSAVGEGTTYSSALEEATWIFNKQMKKICQD
jgi:hypothetical protein